MSFLFVFSFLVELVPLKFLLSNHPFKQFYLPQAGKRKFVFN